MQISSSFLDKYNKPGPRYTSYPPATSFHTGFDNKQYVDALVKSNNDKPESISVYIHIPFCPQLCFFCGCNTTLSKSNQTIRRYIDAVLKEMDTVFQHLDKSRKVSQIHFGGGTPNSIQLFYLEEIVDKIKATFAFTDNPEIAIECSPAYLQLEHIDHLAKIGFNRISLGIQDFNKDVLDAINRRPSKLPIEDVIARIKQNNIKENIDLVYGLPLQTVESFKGNIERILALQPDRVVTFSYAHVPWVKEAQKNLEKYHLPDADEKIHMLEAGYNLLTENGYNAIGMDHYAKPDDELFLASKAKTLHRNFQGYCTRQTTGQVYAFGTSGISQLWSAYSQNEKNLNAYMDMVEKDGLAVVRGYSMSAQETIIREAINEIMCNGRLDLNEIALRLDTKIDVIKQELEYNPAKLQEFIEDKLLTLNNDVIQVSGDGMMVVRNIAMVFDPLLKVEENKFSKTV
jgi:oxygen-independent coproporphyrinogen III oxidase